MESSEITTQPPANEGPGGHIGPYRILRQIGEGGFGQVFEAEQDHPVKRRVAIKVIRLGMDTRDVIARFEAERQALALMDHPHIARVLEAGSTGTGRPYFVMELVRGEPITTYCDGKRLSVDERLKLFEQVCQAVQHAHSKGVIHRDLKPSNVLVSTHDDAPFARVIDFGIAKAIAGRLTDRTCYTAENQLIGTPLYMSPEQAEGSADIDTRSDVYSLGVMLYELLTGSTPVDALQARPPGLVEMQRLIREVDPPLPSAHLAKSQDTLRTLALRYRSEPRTLTRQIRGELDWIVMKALEKERTRRYETANGLAMDVRRYLAGEPVLAAPPSVRYRMGKFVRRNRVAVATGALLVGSLAAGALAFAWQARIAGQRAAELEAVVDHQSDLLARIDPTLMAVDLNRLVHKEADAAFTDNAEREQFVRSWQALNSTELARHLIEASLLDPARDAIARDFAGQPDIAASLNHTLGLRYQHLGLYEKAGLLLEAAYLARANLYGKDARATIESMAHWGGALHYLGELDKAETVLREAVARARSEFGADAFETLASENTLATILESQGKGTEAKALFERVLAVRTAKDGPEAETTLTSMANLGYHYFANGEPAKAEPLMADAFRLQAQLLGPHHQETLMSLTNLAAVRYQLGDLAGAERAAEDAVKRYREVFGATHNDTLLATNNLGSILTRQGKSAEASEHYRVAYEGYRNGAGIRNEEALAAQSNYAGSLEEMGRNDEALLLRQENLEVASRIMGVDSEHYLIAASNLAGLECDLGQYQAALDRLQSIDAATRATFKGFYRNRAGAMLRNRGRALAGLGKYVEAEAALAEAYQMALDNEPVHVDLQRKVAKEMVALHQAWLESGKAPPSTAEKLADWQRREAELTREQPR
jgi:serine/threonine protein kinase/tetratricopeptide (TPR) repeat protein